MLFDKDDEVMTPDGLGTVSFRIMSPPDYTNVQVYSVKLYSKRQMLHYAGTMYAANEVQASAKNAIPYY